MMSVKEYALDINVTVEAVIKKAQELGYDIKNADDMLDEDQIIDLDNTLTMNVNEKEEPEYIDEIHEENPHHPSEEYKNLICLIEKCNDKRNYKQVASKTIDILNNIFKDTFEFKIKLKHEKYGHDFDSEYGILVIDKQSKARHIVLSFIFFTISLTAP